MKPYLLLLPLLALSACSGSNSDLIEFETRTDSIGYVVRGSELSDTIYAAANYSVVWPAEVDDPKLNELRDSLLSLSFGMATPDFAKAADQFLNSPLQSLIAEPDSTLSFSKVSFPEADSDPCHSTATVMSSVAHLTPSLLVIEIDKYYYNFGAAHGLSTRNYLNYAVNDHQLLTASNVFLPGNDAAILSIIDATARRLFDDSTIFPEPITTFDNFQLTPSSIIFIYQPYEIAPYSSGIIEIPINLNDLRRYLAPTVIEALTPAE